MKIRVWNAYASNNSGSYTIVGELPSSDVATEVAAELSAMIDEHTAWLEADRKSARAAMSPLETFCRAHGLTWSANLGSCGDWPEYGADNRPRVTVVGTQVIVHHDYTVTLPPTFGEFFYKKGGRVAHEEDHAHHPIVTVASFWWGWTADERAKMEAELPALEAALTEADGVLAGIEMERWPAVWRRGSGFGEAPLEVGAVFADLLDGISALRSASERRGTKMRVRLYEAPDDTHDPLAYLRPTTTS